MLRVLRLTSAILAIAAVVGWAIPALAAGEGVISGQVVNKTANGSAVSTVEVTLTAYLNGKAVTDEKKATTDASGKFEFRGLSTDNGTTYTVSTNFQNADYVSEDIVLNATGPSQAVELDVYDSTTSDENIQVSNGHMIVYVDQGDLHIEEIWRFSNIGDKTFVSMSGEGDEATLRFTLPSGASLFPDTGSLIKATGAGAVSTSAVPPGVTDVTFSYFIPYQGASMTILRKMDYPIANFSLLVQDLGVKVTSATLTQGNSQMISGTTFLYFTTSNLARDTELDASLSGVVKPSAGSSEVTFLWPWLLVGVAVLGLVMAFAYPRLKTQQTTTDSPAPEDEVALLGELARLDDAYESGTMGEKEYRAQRARVKASLLEVYVRSREP